MSEPVPSKWVAIVVQYGEGQKHLYSDHEISPQFCRSELEAQQWAEDHCRFNQRAMVAVLKVDRLVCAKPVEFERITADEHRERMQEAQ
jgi:hypothetical protein